MQQQQLQLPSNIPLSTPPRSQIPIQPNLNPNNKGVQQTTTLNLPSYRISTIECNEINLQSGRAVNGQTSQIIIEHISDEDPEPESQVAKNGSNQNSVKHPPPHLGASQGCQIDPPYPKRLALSK